VSRVSGLSWEDFVEQRIMQPLNMNSSAAAFNRLKDKSNVIDPHAVVEGKLKTIKRYHSGLDNAAGGIYSNLTDFSKWIVMQMNSGKYGDNLQYQLFSESRHDEMWTPQTIIPIIERKRSPTQQAYNTHFNSYGLGWFISDVKGYKQLAHSGGLPGIVTFTTIVPELKLAIIVFTNQQAGEAFYSVTNTIKDSYLGIKGNDWIKTFEASMKTKEENADKVRSEVYAKISSTRNPLEFKSLEFITGTYTDPWFGDVEIYEQGNRTWLRSKRSLRLMGELFYYKGSTFVVKWVDRSFDADAFVMFEFDGDGTVSGMKWKAVSPLADFSFDFHDLDFKRKQSNIKD
jgi:hypothetical protein